MKSLVGILLPVLVICLAAGCSEELGPERFETTTVTGQVTAMGKPVGPGWIEIIPVEGTTGNMRTARLGPDGRFKVDRAPVGKVAVAFARLPNEMINTAVGAIAARYFFFSNTPIRQIIPNQPNAQLLIDLDAETTNILRNQEKIKRSMQGASE